MKIIQPPDIYNSDCIVEESVRCPFCNAKTEYVCFCNKKRKEVYTVCKCGQCGSAWESDRYTIRMHDSIDIIHRDVKEKCRKILNKPFLLI